ncbi:hypothetical protein ACFSCX_06650 [Bacillus salitolerans]|uniref:Uncharacterized protein n=1 Tax=Bacillus salitolerans TaxID=1437434 RepID=A0ABW4LQB5_9BACI
MKPIDYFIIGCLIGNGDIQKIEGEDHLYFSFEKHKTTYLQNFMLHHSLFSSITADFQKGEGFILPNLFMNEVIKKWYSEGVKIFSKGPDPFLVPFESIVIAINLFGKRQIENIILYSSVKKEYLNILSYSISKQLDLPSVISSSNSIKIYDAPALFLKAFHKVSLIDSTELANYINDNERRDIEPFLERDAIL